MDHSGTSAVRRGYPTHHQSPFVTEDISEGTFRQVPYVEFATLLFRSKKLFHKKVVGGDNNVVSLSLNSFDCVI